MEGTAQHHASLIDTAQTRDEALRHAISAAECYMSALAEAHNADEKRRLRSDCKRSICKAESIKSTVHWTPVIGTGAILPTPTSARSLNEEEIELLLESSRLHGETFPLWTHDASKLASLDAGLNDFFQEAKELELSEAQKKVFAGWKRPWRLDSSRPISHATEVMLMSVPDNLDLAQDITTDCSVIASLCACIARMMKGNGNFLEPMFHPYDEKRRRPRLSTSGRFLLRLNFNGAFREVSIDDRLPASISDRSLHVTDRNNPALLWPALIEKAYLKVRGGYDFPGSNSGTDLWVLTGWIPEQVFLQRSPNLSYSTDLDSLRLLSDKVFPNQIWDRIFRSFKFGDVMITLGTGRFDRREEKDHALTSEHDYAVLDMKLFENRRLVLVKNPWSASASGFEEAEPDSKSAPSTPLSDLYQSAQGTRWMKFEDVLQFYQSLYLNWNPSLFLYREDHHFSWTISTTTNAGLFITNPQYALSCTEGGSVWILLSRHFNSAEKCVIKNTHSAMTEKSSALGFISIYVFLADGRRVYLSDNAMHRGAFVDSPQTLARLELEPNTNYTVVAAHHRLPLPRYIFTLSFFSRSRLFVSPAADRLPLHSTHSNSWTVRTAGGNTSTSTYNLNPQYSIAVPFTADVAILIETSSQDLAINVKLVWGGGKRVTDIQPRDIISDSGDYRRGCALAEMKTVAAGIYTIVCSTFEVGQIGDFKLKIASTVACEVKAVPAEETGRLRTQLPAIECCDGGDRWLAPIIVKRLTRVRLLARCESSLSKGTGVRPLIRIALERGQGPHKSIVEVSEEGRYSDAATGVRTSEVDLTPAGCQQGGVWIVVERLGAGVGMEEVQIEVLSDVAVKVGAWGSGDG